MEKKHKVFNLIILDQSGSMESIKQPIVEGFNEVVQTVKGIAKKFPEQEHLVSLVLFNSINIKTLHFNEAVENLNLLDKNKFLPEAMTPLYDAVGLSINRLEKCLNKLSDYNVLVTILTDGMENASKEFTTQIIKNKIDELENKGWTFTYIGTNHNIYKAAGDISIKNTLYFEDNTTSITKMFNLESVAREEYSQKIKNKEDLISNFYKENWGKTMNKP